MVEEDKNFEIYNWRQCYSLETLTALFEENGLKIIEHYADTAGSPLVDEAQAITIVAVKTAS